MVILDTIQGSNTWLIDRLWRLTSSNLKSNITSAGLLSRSQASIKSIGRMVAGKELQYAIKDNIEDYNQEELNDLISLYTGDKFTGSRHTRRGNELESEAIDAMSKILDNEIHEVGMCVIGESVNGVVSCSPDGRIIQGGKMCKGVEVKSPCLFNYKNHVVEGILPPEYKLQVHASMAICELDTWHFGSFFKGKPLFHVEVKRDDFTDTLSHSFEEFKGMYSERFEVEKNAISKIEGQYL